MKNKLFFLSIFIFTIVYGTSCDKDTNNYTTELTFENLKGNWVANDNDSDIKWLYFESENELFIIQKFYDHQSETSFTYYLDTTNNIYLRPNIDAFDTLPFHACPIKIISTTRIRIEDLPNCLGEDFTEDISFKRD
jgi:hypothetical protein